MCKGVSLSPSLRKCRSNCWRQLQPRISLEMAPEASTQRTSALPYQYPSTYLPSHHLPP